MMKYNNGEAFVEVLNAHGVEKIFLNPGAETGPIQFAVALARAAGKKAPQLILCLDESVAVAAAYGNYMITGKPQVVLVHSEVGALQLGGNVQNIQWGRVPIIILTAFQELAARRTIWNGQPYDHGSILRNSMKYDRCLDGSEDLHEVLTEAFRTACTEPTGPVHLYCPIRFTSKEIVKPEALPAVEEPPTLPPADKETMERIADILLDAKNPLLVSGNAGRYPGNVGALISLAETLSASVLTGYSWMNFPSDHPLCVGIEQVGGSGRKNTYYCDADVILVIDYAMPYVDSSEYPKPDTRILHIDVEPLTQGRLLWDRGADIFIKADSREAIPALGRLLENKITAEKRAELNDRFRRIAARNEETRPGWRTAARNQSGRNPISADYLCYCLNQVIDEDAIVVNHTLSHCASVTEQIVRSKPGTWFSCPAGAIGWALGAALGAASAAPGKTVVSILTDGGFMWSCPASALWASANYRFPFLAIICNNGGYGVVRNGQKRRIGENPIAEQIIAEVGVDFKLDYALIAQGAGAFGRTVTKPEEVLPALREALDVVRDGRPAVLDVLLPRLSITNENPFY